MSEKKLQNSLGRAESGEVMGREGVGFLCRSELMFFQSFRGFEMDDCIRLELKAFFVLEISLWYLFVAVRSILRS